MTSSKKENVLFIGCADGRVRLPHDLATEGGAIVHAIRLPGGILNPQLPRNFGNAPTQQQLENDLLSKIDTMVGLKKPDEIVVSSHHDCGAANGLGLSVMDTKIANRDFGQMLQERFPHIQVRVLHDNHSVCGKDHHGYEVIDFEDEPQLQEAAAES